MASLKGVFKPSYPKKNIGDANMIVYRSSWERKFCLYYDTTESIVRWASEEIAIKYYNPAKKRVARCFPGFYVEYRAKEGGIKKVLIEVKPAKETKPPKYKRRTKSTLIAESLYSQNQAKWAAAKEFCEDNGWEFRILTEKELGVK